MVRRSSFLSGALTLACCACSAAPPTTFQEAGMRVTHTAPTLDRAGNEVVVRDLHLVPIDAEVEVRGLTVTFYVDRDGDGLCGPDEDVFRSETWSDLAPEGLWIGEARSALHAGLRLQLEGSANGGRRALEEVALESLIPTGG